MKFLKELEKALKSGNDQSDAAIYANEVSSRAETFVKNKKQRKFKSAMPVDIEKLVKRMTFPKKEKQTFKQKWKAFLLRSDKKFDRFLMSIYFKIPRWKKKIDNFFTELAFKIHRHVHREDYEKMFKVVEKMDKIQKGTLIENARSRKTINDEESKYRSVLTGIRASYTSENGRDNDLIVEEVSDKFKEQSIQPPTKEGFFNLLEKLKSNRTATTE